MKNFILSIVIPLTLTPCLAQASETQTLKVVTGLEGGGYHAYTESLFPDSEKVHKNGSLEIATEICNSDDPAVGPMQIDALYLMQSQDLCNLTVVKKRTEEAYMFLMVPPDSNISNIDDLNNKKLFVDGKGSGSELTWKTLISIESEYGGSDEWITANPITSDNTFLASSTEYDAAFLVRTPDSTLIQELLIADWKMVPIRDKDINDLSWRNKSLYEKSKACVSNPNKSLFSSSTLCVKTYKVDEVVAVNDATLANRKTTLSIKTTLN